MKEYPYPTPPSPIGGYAGSERLERGQRASGQLVAALRP